MGGSARAWRSIPAVVEWRSEDRRYGRPVAIRLVGGRVPVEVERTWVEGGVAGGDPVFRCFLVRASDSGDGRRFRIRTGRRGIDVEVAGCPEP